VFDCCSIDVRLLLVCRGFAVNDVLLTLERFQLVRRTVLNDRMNDRMNDIYIDQKVDREIDTNLAKKEEIEDKQPLAIKEKVSKKNTRLEPCYDLPEGGWTLEDWKPYIDDEFEAMYEHYPRKIGKKKGFEWLKKNCSGPDMARDIRYSIYNYAKICKNERREDKFIMHFTTFLNQWQDYYTPQNVNLED
jgi:hypothetical protein